ncbi:MAG: HesA/MoeB/ThiF family protein [Pseudomonadota bacterium]|nr:HesA/MoeB/ThiF family protein [Pseudomonadota bacterium]
MRKIKQNNPDLNDEDLMRYNKHILLPEIDIHGQNLLLNKHVALIGLGGLGCPISYYLASSGIGEITIIDKDEIDITNLQRQILYTSDDLKRRKVDVAYERMLALNPNINIRKLDTEINQSTNPDIFNNFDLVIDATDNFETRSLLNRFTLKTKKPLIMGAAIQMSGQVSVFRNDLPDMPCYNCLYENLDNERTSCIEQGVLSSLTGVVGSIQATEAIKVLLNIGESLESKLLIIDMKFSNYKVIKLTKDNNCKICNSN